MIPEPNTEGLHAIGEESLEDFIEELPEEVSQSNYNPDLPPDLQPSTESETNPKTAKRMKAEMKRFKKQISEKLPKMLFDRLAAERGPEWALDQDEADSISDAINTVFDALGLEFEIEPFNVVLRSRMWLFAYPILVVASIFLLKGAKNAESNNLRDSSQG